MAVYLLPDKVVSIALSQVGYKEGANNWNKYAQDLDAIGFYNGKKQNVAWCDVFVDWCVWQAAGKDKARALKALYEPTKDNCGAGCKYSAQYFRKNNAWSDTAVIGSQIFFGKRGEESHTGLVVAIGASTITTVEGNKGNEVKKCSYSKSDSKIAGYGLIKYDNQPQSQPTQPDPEPQPAQTGKEYKVKTNSGDPLRLRAEATTDSAKVGGIPNGKTVTALKIVEGESVGGVKTWIYTSYNGVKGYASGKYLTPTPEIETQAQPDPQPQPDPTPSEPTYMTYKIKKGDTLNKIAKTFGTTVKAIKDANPDKIKNVNKIYTGDTIKIPTN